MKNKNLFIALRMKTLAPKILLFTALLFVFIGMTWVVYAQNSAATPDAYNLLEDQRLIVDAAGGVLSNDGLSAGAVAIRITPTAHGNLVLNRDGSFRYTPAANYFGDDSFTYRAVDGSSSSTATVTFTITAVNDAPTFTKVATVTVAEDCGPIVIPWASAISCGPLESGQLLNLAVSNVNKPALFTVGGQPTIDQDGVLSFTPAPDAFGTAVITVTLQDDGGTDNGGKNTSSQIGNITITPVNDPPVATDGALTTLVNFSKVGKLIASDVDRNPLIYSIVANGTLGTASILNAATGQYSYVANGTPGIDSFTYQVFDGTDVSTAEVVVTILSRLTSVVLQLPAAPYTVNTPINLSAITTGGDGPVEYRFSWRLQQVDGSYSPSLDLLNPGQTSSFSTSETREWTPLDSGPYQLIVTSRQVNSTAGFETQQVKSVVVTSSQLTGNLLLTVPKTVCEIGSPITVTASADGAGDVQFRFIITAAGYSDDSGYINSSDRNTSYQFTPPAAGFYTVLVYVREFGSSVQYSFSQSRKILVDSSTFQRCFWNFEDGSGTLVTDVSGNGNSGSITGDTGGISTWNSGYDSTYGYFNYAGNLCGISASATMLNHLPQGIIDCMVFFKTDGTIGDESTVLSFDNGTADSDSLTICEYFDPLISKRVLKCSFREDGIDLIATISSTDYWRRVTVTWDGLYYRLYIEGKLIDEQAQTSADPLGEKTSLNIGMGAYGNDGRPLLGRLDNFGIYYTPAAVADDFTLLEDHSLTGNVLANDFVPSSTTVTRVDLPAHGTVTLNANGSFTYNPTANYYGSDSFSYHTVGAYVSGTTTVSLQVEPVNDIPTFTPGGTVTVLEDNGPVSVIWATNISAGPNESSQTVNFVVSNNTNPALFIVEPTISADGTLTFTTAADANGLANVSVVLHDSGGTDNGGVDNSVPVSLNITVTAVNDPPVAHASLLTTLVNLTKTGNLSATDVDSTNLTYAIVTQGTLGTATIVNGTKQYSYVANGTAGTDHLTFSVSDGVNPVATATLTVTVLPRLTSVTLNLPAAPYLQNSDILLSTVVTGPAGIGPVENRFGWRHLREDGTYTTLADFTNPAYIASPDYTWNPQNVGPYLISVFTRQIGGTTSYEVSNQKSVLITSPRLTGGLSLTVPSTGYVNTPVTISATAAGTGPMQFRYVVTAPGFTTYDSGYFETAPPAIRQFTPTVAATYKVVVYVRETGSSCQYSFTTFKNCTVSP